MVLPFVALALALPQLAGYAVTRLARRAGVTEWLGAAVAAYTAIWYPIFGSLLKDAGPDCSIGPILAWTTLFMGLCYQLVVGGVLATALVRRKRAAAPPASPAP
jgi:hypothetical protein